MDGFDPSRGVIIMAATIVPISRAATPSSRCTRAALASTRPSSSARSRRGRPGSPAPISPTSSTQAALLAARREKPAVGIMELEEAIDRVLVGPERKSRVISKQEKRTIALHEMGHALVALRVSHANPVHRVTIVPRGATAPGMTMQRPLQDRYLMTEPELRGRLTILLRGRCAEEIVFDDVSTGAQNDLKRATDIARAMVTQYGMSPKLGPLSFGHDGWRTPEGQALFPMQGPAVSDFTGQRIDEEITEMLETAHEQATSVLKADRILLERLSSLLLEVEVIEVGRSSSLWAAKQRPMPTVRQRVKPADRKMQCGRERDDGPRSKAR
jgi:cell division protease FtsH